MVTTLVALVSAAMGAGIVWAIHLRQQRTQLSDRLRLAYVDFFASVNSAKVAKVTVVEDERLFKAGGRLASKLEASAREFLDTAVGLDNAMYMIRLLEKEQGFIDEVKAICSNYETMIDQTDGATVAAAATDLGSGIDRLITRITETHPLLGL